MNPAKLFHFHLRPWSWRRWTPPAHIQRSIVEQGFQVVVSAQCSRCDWVRFKMNRRT